MCNYFRKDVMGMAKEKKVQQITDMEVDFAQWYTDICRKAELWNTRRSRALRF